MTQEAPSIPRIYWCSEVATELRRSENAVRWLWSTGALKSTRSGGRRFSTAQQIAEFLGEAS